MGDWHGKKKQSTRHLDAPRGLLPEYKKHPDLVVQNLYLDTVQQVIDGMDEKFILPAKAEGQTREQRILLNRDPALKRSGPAGPTSPTMSGAPQ